MCGIAGIVGAGDDATIDRMMRAIGHRGPDLMRIDRRGMVHLGAARLSFVDLNRGAQPLWSEDGKRCILFNGEIYNHAELRSELERRGRSFRTRSDTEVVLRLFEEFGTGCLGRLNGMFAFVVYDGESLFLARDELGIKPLYFCHLAAERLFVFASEIKALLKHPQVPRRLHQTAVSDWIALGYPVGSDTFLAGIEALPAGHAMRVSVDRDLSVGPRIRYGARHTRDSPLSLAEAEDAVERSLEAAVQSHLAADTEIGVTLSGGIDSTLIALLAAGQRDALLRTFTIGRCGTAAATADTEQSAIVARRIGACHRQVDISFDRFLDAVPDCIAATEFPATLSGVAFHVLCRDIGASLKGCLNGEGADELFGGYQEYVDRDYQIGRLQAGIRRLKAAGLAASQTALGAQARFAAATGGYLEAVFDFNLRDQLERRHLDPIDKMAMASSVEMRVPYLDRGVVDLATRLPVSYLVRQDLGIRKYLLRRIFLRRFGDVLPDIALRQKETLPSSGRPLQDAFNRYCETALPGDWRNRYAWGSLFDSASELVMFELFREIHIERGGDARGISIREFVAGFDGAKMPATAEAGAV
ncbi:MAG TPA: asparagine synthase (glutamine-hydrolyzing) [Rhizomicrobium sp.]|nr:asparagine synthase (glutamine-hydrolyzing) [Rhizomicrobium sp.]